MSDADADVVRLRTDDVEFRIGGMQIRLDPVAALQVIMKGARLFGFTEVEQTGLKVGHREAVEMDDVRIRDTIERVRASGTKETTEPVFRVAMLGPWRGERNARPAPEGKQRRFLKEAAPALTKAPARPAAKKSSAPVNEPGDGLLDVQLFDHPLPQLQYEVRHMYLVTVRPNERDQWPLPPVTQWKILPSFLDDLDKLGGQVSRKQVLMAIIDVVTGRVTSINSREPRPLRRGGGERDRPIITRGDEAVAWRANVSNVTAAARRIMWWKTKDGVIELTRLAKHDDMFMPER